ncbi:MAG: PIG-L deacetylase family protein [Bryobacteraceae bacterium]
MRTLLTIALLVSTAAAQSGKGPVLVITPSSRDYLLGAGGTLARMSSEGRKIVVLQIGNEEKDSIGLGPAETRLANNAEGEAAAKILGVQEVLNLGHKSGELGYVSSSELRNHVMAAFRFYKPETVFFPDWYVHYLEDRDVWYVGHMAEEAPYGGGSLFLQEFTYMGMGGAAAREYFFYSPNRPYRPREGGEGSARMTHFDIGPMFDRKVKAAQALKTSNHRYAAQVKLRLDRAGTPSPLLARVDEQTASDLVRSYLEELAAAVGKPHGIGLAEEFNHLSPRGGIPEHIREHARPIAGNR